MISSKRCAGQEVEVDMENDTLTNVASGKVYKLKPLGEVSPSLQQQLIQFNQTASCLTRPSTLLLLKISLSFLISHVM